MIAIRTAIVAAALVTFSLASAVSARAESLSQSLNNSLGQVQTFLFSVAAGTYNLSLDLTSLASWSSFTGYLMSGTTQVATVSGGTSGSQTYSTLSNLFSLAAGQYSLVLQGVSFGGETEATVSLAQVPAPIAAAGLPGVLALIGYGLYRRRQTAA